MNLIRSLAKIFFTLIILFSIFGIYRTWATARSQNQEIFLDGTEPVGAPNGSYLVQIRGFSGILKGMEFNPLQDSGQVIVNVLGEDKKKYNFKTYITQGLHDPGTKVLKLDLGLAENVFWARPFTADVVEIKPAVYLGKINYYFIPGYPFAFGFFKLEKKTDETK